MPYKLTSPPYYAKSRLEGLTRMLAMLEQEVELLKQDIARESTEPIIPENQ